MVYCADGSFCGAAVRRAKQSAGAAVVNRRGNVVSALIGVTVGMWVPQLALACGLAAGLAIAAMYFLRCLHPPGGAVALTAILGGAGFTARDTTLC